MSNATTTRETVRTAIQSVMAANNTLRMALLEARENLEIYLADDFRSASYTILWDSENFMIGPMDPGVAFDLIYRYNVKRSE